MTSTYTRIMTGGAVLIGLAGIIAIHVMDLQGKIEETPYLGLGYIAVCLVAGFLMVRLVSGPTRRDYLAAAALSAAVFLGFVVNRTVGMPGAMGDVGNWMEPLGLLSLVVEAFTCVMAVRGAMLPVATLPVQERERVDALG